MMTAEDVEDDGKFPDDDDLEVRRLSWPFVAGVLTTLVGNVARSVGAACDDLATGLARHTEWARQAEDRQAFERDVTRDLDAIATTWQAR